jgi:hypothetical protein
VVISCEKLGQNDNIKTGNKSFKGVEYLKPSGASLRNNSSIYEEMQNK